MDTPRQIVASPNETRVALVGDDNNALKVYDIKEGHKLAEVPLGPQNNYQTVWSPDSTTIYTLRLTTEALELVAVDSQNGGLRVLFSGPQSFYEDSLAVSPNGALLAFTVSDDRLNQTLRWRINNLSDASEAHLIDVRPTYTSGEFSPDSKSFWLQSSCGLARFDLTTGRMAPVICNPLSRIDSLAFSDDGSRLFGMAGAQLITWNVATGEEVGVRANQSDFFRNNSPLQCVHISPDARRTLWAGAKHIHTAEDGQQLMQFLVGGKYTGSSRTHSSLRRGQHFDFSEDTQWIVFEDNTQRANVTNLWKTGEIRKISRYNDLSWPSRKAISPDGKLVSNLDYAD